MKKAVACVLLFVFVLSISLTACKEEMVTIYIPKMVSVFDHNGNLLSRMHWKFEEGWQDKETFVVQHVYTKGGQSKARSTTYGNKTAVLYYGGSSLKSIEEHYDAQGRMVQEILHYAEGWQVQKQVNTRTYDSLGRITSEAIVRDGEELVKRTFTCEEVDGNYVCKAKAEDGVNREMTYRKDGKLLKDKTYSSTSAKYSAYTYDENGCVSMEEGYSWKTFTTYLAVEVRISTANRLPQFVRVG